MGMKHCVRRDVTEEYSQVRILQSVCASRPQLSPHSKCSTVLFSLPSFPAVNWILPLAFPSNTDEEESS